MIDRYNVVFTGHIKETFSKDEVVKQMVSFSKLDKEKVEKLLFSGKAVILKKQLEQEKAEKLKERLENIGLEVVLKSYGEAKPVTSPPITSSKPIETTESPVVPDKEQTAARESNPYAAPKAELKKKKEDTGGFASEPNKLKASHGWFWIKSAITMFLEYPWRWLGMVFVACVVASLPSIIPFIGPLLQYLLFPIFGGGLMLAAYRQYKGEEFSFGYVFKGFSVNTTQLFIVGLLYLVGFIGIALIMVIPFGAGAFALMGFTGDPEAAMTTMGDNALLLALIPLIIIALSVPLMMCVWFAPSLVAINNLQAVAAMKLSFRACLRNVLPFLIYSLVFMGVMFLFGIVMAISVGGITWLSGGSESIFMFIFPFLVIMLLALPLLPVSVLTIFTSFRDIFYKSDS